MKKYTLDIVFDYLDIKCNARDTRYNIMHNKNKNDKLEVFALAFVFDYLLYIKNNSEFSFS